MANLTSTTVTGTLDTTSTITGPGAGVSAINASNVSTGTLSSDRLPTVPTSKGGTGLTSVGTSGQVLTVTAPGALAFQNVSAGGDYIQRVYTTPATWTKPADIKAVKVRVWGGGGNGGNGARTPNPGAVNLFGSIGGTGGYSEEYIDSPSLTAPVAVTVGGASGTSSFGAFLSATGGSSGNPGSSGGSTGTPGNPGTGTGGQINLPGLGGVGGGLGQPGKYSQDIAGTSTPSRNGVGYAGGGSSGPNEPGGVGAPGAVIIEEYY